MIHGNSSSNAQEIRKCMEELLQDGKVHSRKDLIDHVREKSQKGKSYTDGMLTGALRSLVSGDTPYFVPSRSFYQKKASYQQKSVDDNRSTVSTRVKAIMEETKHKLSEACTVNLLDTSEPDLNAVKKVSEFIKQIDEFESGLSR